MDSLPPTPPAEVATFEHFVDASYTVTTVMLPRIQTDYGAAGLDYHAWFPAGVEPYAGARIIYGARVEGNVGVEPHVGVLLSPHFRPRRDADGRTASWRPAIGLEAGLTTFKYKFILNIPQDSSFRSDPEPGTFYAEVIAAPLRFRLTHFMATVLGVGIGAPPDLVGRQLRLQLDVLQVGVFL